MNAKTLGSLLAGAVIGFTPVASAQEAVDLVLHNGKVFTADDLMSIQRVVVIKGDKIVAVGGNELVKRYRARRTIDLKGRLVTPGFNDTHSHIRGEPNHYIDFSGTTSIEEFKARVRAKVQELGPGKWITGRGWSEDEMVEKRRPLRWDLDEVAPANPVIIARAGGHSSVANSLALKMAGVDESTPQPEHGVIEKDEQGRLNGIIRESAGMVSRLVPPASSEELRAPLIQNLRDLLPLGITSIILAGNSPEGFREWQDVYREHSGELPRATVQIRPEGENADQWVESLRRFGMVTGQGSEWVRVGAVKIGVDGGYTGPAAWTLEHYKGQPDYYGHERMTEHELYQLVKGAHELGWQMGFHTIGDAAIKMAVDVFARVLDEAPRANHRHYVTHFTVTPPDATLRKMADHGILIAQQPNFTYTLEGRYVDNLTPMRAAHNNPLRTPMSYGIFMAFGSDRLPIGPMVGLYAAVTRKGMSGAVYGREERLSMPEAIAGYTRNAAYLSFEENLKGTIEPGKLADLIVVSEDLLTIDPERIMGVKVDLTILGGKPVYQRPQAAMRGAPDR